MNQVTAKPRTNAAIKTAACFLDVLSMLSKAEDDIERSERLVGSRERELQLVRDALKLLTRTHTEQLRIIAESLSKQL